MLTVLAELFLVFWVPALGLFALPIHSKTRNLAIKALAVSVAIILTVGSLVYRSYYDKGIEDVAVEYALGAACSLNTLWGVCDGLSREVDQLNCEQYASAFRQGGKPNSVACNTNTASGYFWSVRAPRIRPYGYWGMSGTGSTPSCSSETDVGAVAETATFSSAQGMWEVREYWCRNQEDGTCPLKLGREGPSNSYIDQRTRA